MARELLRGRTVTVKAKGQILDRRCFRRREDAQAYKWIVRRWALERRVLVQLYSQ